MNKSKISKKVLILVVLISISVLLIWLINLIKSTLLLNVLSLVILLVNGALFAFSKEISEESPLLSWMHKTKFKIPATILVVIMLYIINNRKDDINAKSAKQEQHGRDSIAEHKQSIRDSIHEAKEVSYFLESQRQLSEVMAKYGLKYDSAKREIEKLVSDSMRALPDPELNLCDNGIILDSIRNNKCFFRVSVCNDQSPANNIDIKSYFIAEVANKFYLVHNADSDDYVIFNRGSKMSTESSYNTSMKITYDHAKMLYCFLKGSYTDLRGVKKYHMNSFYDYVFWNKRIGVPSDKLEQKLRAFLKGKGIN